MGSPNENPEVQSETTVYDKWAEEMAPAVFGQEQYDKQSFALTLKLMDKPDSRSRLTLIEEKKIKDFLAALQDKKEKIKQYKDTVTEDDKKQVIERLFNQLEGKINIFEPNVSGIPVEMPQTPDTPAKPEPKAEGASADKAAQTPAAQQSDEQKQVDQIKADAQKLAADLENKPWYAAIGPLFQSISKLLNRFNGGFSLDKFSNDEKYSADDISKAALNFTEADAKKFDSPSKSVDYAASVLNLKVIPGMTAAQLKSNLGELGKIFTPKPKEDAEMSAFMMKLKPGDVVFFSDNDKSVNETSVGVVSRSGTEPMMKWVSEAETSPKEVRISTQMGRFRGFTRLELKA